MRPLRGAEEPALLALDRHAGVVGDLLAAAGETIEQRGLAAVRHADEREREARRGKCRGRRSVHGGVAGRGDATGRACAGARATCCSRSTQTLCASRRRSASVVWPDAHHEWIAAGTGLRENLHVLPVHEAELEQPPLEG